MRHHCRIKFSVQSQTASSDRLIGRLEGMASATDEEYHLEQAR